MQRFKKIAAGLASGLLLDCFAGPRWSSWNETVPAIAFCMGACFLAGLSFGGVMRGPGARPAVIVFPLALVARLVLRNSGPMLPAILWLGIMEVLPALAGGLAGLALHRYHLRAWWFAAAALLAAGLITVGPPG